MTRNRRRRRRPIEVDLLTADVPATDALHRLGLQRQERVAIYAGNCAEYFELYFACHVGGFIATPVNFRLAVPEVAWVLGDATPKVLPPQGIRRRSDLHRRCRPSLDHRHNRRAYRVARSGVSCIIYLGMAISSPVPRFTGSAPS